MSYQDYQIKQRSRTLQEDIQAYKHYEAINPSQPKLHETPKSEKTILGTKLNRIKRKPFNQEQQIPTKKVSQFEKMKAMIKSELQKLGYREKLHNIQAVILSSRDLCQRFGYFTLTCAMIDYHPEKKIKLSLWIHPDRRITKPLHPIQKQGIFQTQIQFISDLKKILKMMFPTIELGKGKTFTNLLFHITELKRGVFLKTKKAFDSPNNQSSQIRKKAYLNSEYEIDRNLITSLKTIPRVREQQNCQDFRTTGFQSQKFNSFTGNKMQKATASTLLESIRSNTSMRDRIKAVLRKNQGEQRKQNCFGEYSKTIPIPEERRCTTRKNSITQQKFELKGMFDVPEKSSQEIKSQSLEVADSKEKKNKVKKSQILTRKSRLKMATSGELEGDFNNLFESDVFMNGPNGTYYNEPDKVRNSMLSQVMQDFQHLLF